MLFIWTFARKNSATATLFIDSKIDLQIRKSTSRDESAMSLDMSNPWEMNR